MNNGRLGKGAVVVFASGNKSKEVSDYPGNFNPDILVVGSINNSKNRSSFSSYGLSLDITAPGEDILSTIPGNKVEVKSGTSMAAPHVSGVAALVLSVNPNLTRKQVVDIIEKSANKGLSYSFINDSSHKNGLWNNEVGYGIYNAYSALQMANENVSLSNKTFVGSNNNVYGWNITSSNITLDSGSTVNIYVGNSLTVNSNFEVQSGANLNIY